MAPREEEVAEMHQILQPLRKLEKILGEIKKKIPLQEIF